MKKLFLLLCFLSITVIFSNDKDTLKVKKKIGLVLSGGGAKGFAHIGVIRELEKLGIKPDYISGTSMGAVIGGLYACGYNSYEIEKIMKENNFMDLITDQIPYERNNFFRKQQSDYMLSVEIVDGSLVIPSGISRGVLFFDFYSKYTSYFHEVNDFSKLPIPFVCVATNLENGKPVYLEKGLLPIAVRASGSYPTLSRPIYIDDMILVDGGISNNYPAEILKIKGMDYVIGVNVEKSLLTKKELKNAAGILDQLVSFGISNTTQIQKQYVDIELRPNVNNYGIIDFNSIDDIIMEGELCVENKIDDINKLILKDSDTTSLKDTIIKEKGDYSNIIKNTETKFFIKKIEIYGNNNYTKNYIDDKLRLKEGESYDMDEINEGMERVHATENFDEFYCKNKISDSTLLFFVKEKEEDYKLKLTILHYDDINGLALPVNLTLRNLVFKNSTFSNSFVFSSERNFKFKTEYYVDNGIVPSYGINFGGHFLNSVTSNFKYFDYFLGTVINNNEYRFDYNYLYTNIYTQSTFREYFSLKLGAEILKAYVKTEQLNGNGYLRDDNNTYGDLYASINLNTLNHKYIPMRGNYIQGEYRLVFFDIVNYGSSFLKVNTLSFLPIYRDNISLFLESNVSFNLFERKRLGGIWDLSIGGQNSSLSRNFINFAGINSFDITAKSMINLNLGFKFKFRENHYVSTGVNFLLTEYNLGSGSNSTGTISLSYTYYNSIIGPINISMGYNPNNFSNINKRSDNRPKTFQANVNLGFLIKLY